jgi:hypothetical protein
LDDVREIVMVNVMSFNNRADAMAATIPDDIKIVQLAGYYDVADAPTATYVRVQVEPSHNAKFQSVGGKWWRLDPQGTSVDIRWFGAKPIVDFDNRTALVDAIECVTRSHLGFDRLLVRSVFIPDGAWEVSGTSIFVRGVTILGTGPNTSTIIFTGKDINTGLFTTNAIGFWFDGGAYLPVPSGRTDFWNFEVSGGGIQSLGIWMRKLGLGLYGVLLQGDQYRQPDECVFEDLKITGGGQWFIPLYINGIARIADVPPKDEKPRWPIGVRKISIRNLFLGEATNIGMSVLCVQELTILGMGIYGGVTQKMIVDGTDTMPSTVVQILGSNIQEYLWVTRAVGMNVSSYCPIVTFSTGTIGCAYYGSHKTLGYSSIPSTGNLGNAATF